MWQSKEPTPWPGLGTTLEGPPSFRVPHGGGCSFRCIWQLSVSLWPTLVPSLPLPRGWLQQCFPINPEKTHLCIRVGLWGDSTYFRGCQEYSDKAASRMRFRGWSLATSWYAKRPSAGCGRSTASSWPRIPVQLSALSPAMDWGIILV